MQRLNVIPVVVVLLLAATINSPALARNDRGSGGPAGGARFSGAHIGGTQASGTRFSGSHVRGGQVNGSRFSGGRSGGGHFAGSRFRGRIGVIVGAPLFFPSWYYYPPPPRWYYDSAPPPVYYYEDTTAHAAPSSPPALSEQDPGPAAHGQQPSYWYYCADSKAYYPYVKDCPGGWTTETPSAPSTPSEPSAN